MKFEITSRWHGSVLFSIETESIKLALEAGVKSGANLTSANLRGADLRNADLTGANLRGADLTGADLRNADLTGADLTGAELWNTDLRNTDLRGADLRNANLTGANLRNADLTGTDLTGADLRNADLRNADLRGADLTGADLRNADLRNADLRGANLTPIRDDIWAVLSSAPSEVLGLRAAILEGRIDGSTYEGECSCLVGTLANVRLCTYNSIPTLTPNSSRPAERFFLSIRKGDTPETSQCSKFALEWVDLWLANMRAAFAGNV